MERERVKRLAATAAVALGVAGGATMGAAGILWWWGRGGLVYRTAIGIMSQSGMLLRWRGAGLFAGVAALLCAALGVIAAKGPAWVRAVIATWSLPALGAALYASTLPAAMPWAPAHSGVSVGGHLGGKDILWPLLALGIQSAALAAGLLWWSVSSLRARRYAPAAVAMIAFAGATVAAAVLISRGVSLTSFG
ncbi:MAG: hypothetical protein HY775_10745 [Acidobacteria bacterium]|nr:hypothetical protein [Acidobacteriota bacterium]